MNVHHPIPTVPSQQSSSTIHPQSRSEKMLLDALRRHEREQRQALPLSPSPTPHRAHRRRHSHAPSAATTNSRSSRSDSPSDDDVDEPHSAEYTHAAFLFRSAITPTPATSPRRSSIPRRAPVPAYGGDAEFRAVSPTPRPTLHRAAHTESTPLTPHEQVLRARLERVLQAGRTEVRRTKRRSLGSSPEPATSASSSAPRTPPHVRSRSKTDPPPPLPLVKQNHSAPASELLTPPPTPPGTARTPPLPTTPASPHHQQHSQPASPPPTPFNAHAASRHCRSIEGYVSFAAVEGLGAPPDLDADEIPPVPEPTGGTARRALGGIWRVWG